ncbi:hypothetical protein [Christensenella tenuis]|uniref:Helix-turn-helix domain-containing protein n=1 Tax=Christensenella tenuis TaxID=2763033 RepID=A0ABR7EET8_9FIRM|nr:hypothetical protein [Christensenella tenuis]MBC5647544.1 hypothetical protein [Christensenella tenuis]
MTSGGFIKLHRKLTEWEWYSDPCTKDVFLHLLLTANHKTRREKGVTYKRGQAVFGRREMALKLGISERNVRTALNHLKSTNEITIKATKRGSVATIINYDKYQVADIESVQQSDQGNDQKVTNNRPTSDQQVTTNKNDKNDKNIKRGGGKSPAPPKFIIPSIEEIEAYCRERGNDVDAERFWNFYNSKGWYVGKNKMKSWKSAVITWEKRNGHDSGEHYEEF